MIYIQIMWNKIHLQKKLNVYEMVPHNVQLKVEVMCDAAFQPTNPDVVVTIGKEHLAWWNIYPEQQAIQMQCKADYDVRSFSVKFLLS